MSAIKRAAKFIGICVVAVTLVTTVAVWLITHDAISKIRSMLADSPPVPPAVRAAIIAVEDPLLDRPRISLRVLMPPRKGVAYCGPSSIHYGVVRSVSPPARPLQWHFRTAVTTLVVSQLFSPDELLRIYASQIYLGGRAGGEIIGVEEASAVYFGKKAHELAWSEAAMVGAMIRSPNVYSPVKQPKRALERRNKVLEKMRQRGFIDEAQYLRAVAEPLPASQS